MPTYQSFFADVLKHHKQLVLEQVIQQLSPCVQATPDTASLQCEAQAAGAAHGEAGIGLLQVQERVTGARCRKRDDEDDDDDKNSQRPRKSAKSTAMLDPRDRLACPYFQRNPHGPNIHPACRGLGFENLSRVK